MALGLATAAAGFPAGEAKKFTMGAMLIVCELVDSNQDGPRVVFLFFADRNGCSAAKPVLVLRACYHLLPIETVRRPVLS